jgi:hypothetical protein
MGTNDFRLPVVGCVYENDDGTSRQEELARCTVGERVELHREPDNPHDPSAVAVLTERGIRIGYIGANYTAWIGSKIDRGYDVEAAIEQIRGGGRTGLPLSAVLAINMDGEDPGPG